MVQIMSGNQQDTKVDNAFQMESQTIAAPVRDLQSMTPNQILEAYRAALIEHKMSFKDSFRIYKKALFWSAVMAFSYIEESYDTILLSNFQALPSFQKFFGHPVKGKAGSYQVQPKWQTAFTMSQAVGSIIGLVLNGWLVDRYGHKKISLLACVLIVGFTFILFFAQNDAMILVGEGLLNIPMSFINNVAPAYAIEMAPLSLRSYGPVAVHLFGVFGNILGSGILNAWVGSHSNWAWRIPYALQWFFPVPLFIGFLFAPESPWWLVRKGKHDRALKTLDRLSNHEADNESTLALIQHTVELERALKSGGTYWDCFKGTNLRRTELAIAAWLAQELTGFALPSGAYFFEQAGLSTKDSFALSVGQYAMAGVATMCCMALLPRVGRRILWIFGSLSIMCCLGIVGILSLLPHQTPAVVWPQGVMILVRFFLFGVSLGPLSFLISTEVSAVRLRQKTLAIARVADKIVATVSGVISPFLINPTAANLKGKACWIAVGFNLLIAIYGYYRVPETKGRNAEELDILFEKRLPARQFKHFVISEEEEFGVRVEKADGEVERIADVPTILQ